jgi:hypothetical protein
MILTKKRISLIVILIVLSVLMVIWGIQKYREDTVTEERALTQGFQIQERVEKEYIPAKLKQKGSDELTKIGINLWGE